MCVCAACRYAWAFVFVWRADGREQSRRNRQRGKALRTTPEKHSKSKELGQTVMGLTRFLWLRFSLVLVDGVGLGGFRYCGDGGEYVKR